jgi:cephalosporin hydroxylase
MFPLWDVAIAPVLHAAHARRVVEIGALRGETTVRMLDDLGPDAELDVIDPEPAFDPAEHERRFPGRYRFHRGLSLDVLPTLGPVDAALIDGDHNWYSVYNELRLLAEAARRHGGPLPVLILHDVLWPYGRRDLYYAPERIPPEFRHPYRQAGMNPGAKRLHPTKGLNPTMCNAEEEGGPRNGVMTGLEDFLAEHPRSVRTVVLPIYFGLAIVVEDDRLAECPELSQALDRLESSEGRYELLQVAEATRLRAMVFQHTDHFRRDARADRAVGRYLAVVKDALLDRHYLENEVRLDQLTAKGRGQRPHPTELRDPVRTLQDPYRRLERQRFEAAGPDDAAASSFLPYAPMGRGQLDHLEAALDAIRSEGVPGDLVECGTGRGGGAIFMRTYLEAHEIDGALVWVVDRFRSSPEPERAPSLPPQGVAGFRADLNLVRDGFARFDVLDDRVRFVQGPPDALDGAGPDLVALLRIGRPAADDAGAILEALYDRVADGGVIVVDPGIRKSQRPAVERFRAERQIETPLQPVDGSALSWRKAPGEARSPARADERLGSTQGSDPAHPRLAPPLPADPVELSVVVVVYNMRREARRTLHALSRAYQDGIQGTSYEVVVVENGSDDDQKLGAAFVDGFGSEFRYLDLAGDARPSPVGALNRGIELSRGRALALMIDGAHVVTPGVLRFGLQGLATYAPAIVATQQWYIGPGQQSDAIDNGYDRAYEDRLFDRIEWPSNGYRLFEIGHFVGDRDWLDGVWESNCLFVTRAQLEQAGGFEERFSLPGGGYANLELYERLGSSPDVTVCSIIGEGSFHQSHGGTTTNQADAGERRSRVFGYGQHYAELRGRAFRGPGKPIHFVGRITTGAARRTKPRRLSTRVFADAAEAIDGRPDQPAPVPDDLRSAFTDAVWRNLPWRHTTWLDAPVRSAPTDLLAYQEIVSRVRPDWIIDIGGSDEGRAIFLASICDLVGHGRVLSIRHDAGEERPPTHPRLVCCTGAPLERETCEHVHALVGGGNAAVVLGACADRPTTVAQFDAYADLVGPGSYVVVTDTVVNGRPVWPSFGPGPGEAVKQILARHGDFVPDPAMEKYALSFNPGGFLRRVT